MTEIAKVVKLSKEHAANILNEKLVMKLQQSEQ